MPNYISGKYINGYSTFHCICGSTVQSRNINNHFNTQKHRNFLLYCQNLIDDYESMSVEKIAFKLTKGRSNDKTLKKHKLPITITFD